MASHKGWDEHFPVTSVATSGGSFNLAKGQLALIDLEGVPTATNGLRIIGSVNGVNKNRQFQLRLGKHGIANNRSQSSKDWSTQTFRLAEIIDLKVDAPEEGIITDSFTLGYNGIDDDTAIVLAAGANEEISINLKGQPIGNLGYHDGVEVKLYLDQPNSAPLKSMQEIVETAVKQFNNYKLMGDVPITNYVKATAVNSKNNALSGTPKYFYTLTVEDEGDSNALAAIQAQYDVKVVKTDRVGNESIYTIIADAPEVVTAGDFEIDKEYVITTVGSTDFTLIGATSNTVGVKFTATGVGTGSGTATTVVIPAFTKNKAWKVKGCANCPAGYSAYVDGFVYAIGLEDDGANSVTAIQAISSNTEANSAVRVSMIGGFSVYTVVTTEALSDAEINTFLATNPEATIDLVTDNAAAVCVPSAVTSVEWVQSPEPCYTTTETYTITLADDECGNDKLAKLQAAYPDLNVSIVESAGCNTKYEAEVITNLVCDDCDDIYRDLFISEAPEDFEYSPWKAEPKTYDDEALMGIRFDAQPIKFYGSEVYRDDMPFIATSVRLGIAGGAVRNINESFYEGTTGRFALTVNSIAAEPENWGGNLREFEDITRRRQEGVSRHECNNYAKWVLGEETLLKADVPYVDYILTVRLKKYAQSFSGELNETINYHFLVEPGVHVQVESLLNSLATAAGLPPVQAYAKSA